MPRIILTEAHVKALRRRKTTYDIRDGDLTRFGVRVVIQSETLLRTLPASWRMRLDDPRGRGYFGSG